MKKLMTIAVAAVISAGCFWAAAQGKNDVNLYIGGANGPFMSATISNGASIYSRYAVPYELYSFYEPCYMLDCGPTVTLDYNRRMLGWLTAGIQANWARVFGTRYYLLDNAPGVDVSQNIVEILPQAKFFIPGFRHFRPYGKVGVGIGFSLGDRLVGKPVFFAWDIVPAGFEWGSERLYFTAEVSLGSVNMGGRMGIGYRF